MVKSRYVQSLALWRDTYPGVMANGTLVVAGTRDRSELVRFARMTDSFQKLDALEPGLEGRLAAGLYYPAEAHMLPVEAMRYLLAWCGQLASRSPPVGQGRAAPTKPPLTAGASRRAGRSRGPARRQG